MVLISEKTGVLYAEHNEREEAATDSYSVTGDSLQYIYSVLVTKNHQNIQSRCLVHEFCSKKEPNTKSNHIFIV